MSSIPQEPGTSWKYKGRAYYYLKRYDEAVSAFNTYLEKDVKSEGLSQDHAELWFCKGLCFFSKASSCHELKKYSEIQKILEQATDSFEKATDINGKYEDAWYYKGLTFYEQKEYSKAIEAFEKVVEIYDNYIKEGLNDFLAFYKKGLALYALNKYTEALDAFDKALEINQNNVSSWFQKGIVLLKLERYDESLDSFEKALKLDPEDANIWNYKSLAQIYSGRFDPAREDLDKAIRFCSGIIGDNKAKIEANAFYYKGISYQFQSNEEERYKKTLDESLVCPDRTLTKDLNENALEYFNRALRIKPDFIEVLCSKALVYQKLKEFKKALETLKQAEELDISNARVCYAKGLVFMEGDHKDHDIAIKSFEDAVKYDPKYVNACEYIYYLICDVCDCRNTEYSFEKRKEIKQNFERAIQIYPNNIWAHIFLGMLLWESGDIEGASKKVQVALNECSARDNEKSFAYCLKGQIAIENKKYNEAILSFEKAVSLNPSNPNFILLETYAKYLKLEFSGYKLDKIKYEEEILSLVRNLENASSYGKAKDMEAHFLYYAGCLYYKMHDFLKAVDVLKECTEKCEDVKSDVSSDKDALKLSKNIRVNATSESSIGNNAKKLRDDAEKLRETIWKYQVEPHNEWWEWWWHSPNKRFLFGVIIVAILVMLFVLPLNLFWINNDDNLSKLIPLFSNTIQYALLIFLLVFLLLSPCIAYIKGKDIEVEIRHSPPPSIEFYPIMPQIKIELALTDISELPLPEIEMIDSLSFSRDISDSLAGGKDDIYKM